MISAAEALERLKDGNQRFVKGEANQEILSSRRGELVEGQNPFAIILGCSDSRVPAEIVFGQGLGDLFVIRVAGNIVAPSQIGSVEFAAEAFGTKLVVVLGHSRCGAVSAGVEELLRPVESRSPNLRAIVERITPSIEILVNSAGTKDKSEIIAQAVRANIKSSVNQLKHGSRIIEDLTASEGLKVVGAEYCLDTGLVEFL